MSRIVKLSNLGFKTTLTLNKWKKRFNENFYTTVKFKD